MQNKWEMHVHVVLVADGNNAMDKNINWINKILIELNISRWRGVYKEWEGGKGSYESGMNVESFEDMPLANEGFNHAPSPFHGQRFCWMKLRGL